MGDELSQYIFEQQKAGYSNEGIRTQLRLHGWTEEAMAKSFNEAEQWHQDRKYAGYSVASILLIVVSTLAIVGAAQLTGFASGGKIACLLENPQNPGLYDFVFSEDDCTKIALSTLCEPVHNRVAVESDDSVLFEARLLCKGISANVYMQ